MVLKNKADMKAIHGIERALEPAGSGLDVLAVKLLA
jgi:hypothetical protein